MNEFPYSLPAYNELADKRKDEAIGSYDRIKYAHFIRDDVSLESFDKGLMIPFNEALSTNLNLTNIDTKTIGGNVTTYVKCELSETVHQENVEKECVEY